MKIRYLINNAYGAGGTIRTTLNMANALSDRGHDVELISLRRLRAKPVFPISDKVKVRVIADQSTGGSPPAAAGPLSRSREVVRRAMLNQPSLLLHRQDRRYATYSLYSDVRLLRFLRNTTDGVLISTRPALNIAVARYARTSVIRIGQEHLNLGRHAPKARLKGALARHYPRLDALTTLTEADAEAYRLLLGDSVRVVTMPNAVPDMNGVRASLDSNVVGAAGRLEPQKGFDMLIAAFAEVVAKHPDWHLHIFGRGVKEDSLRRKISRLGLDDRVVLRGFTNRLAEEMSKCSIYALSSRFEGFPMVLLEAMMCGLPPVAFDCPTGPRELIDHGVDGLVVPPADVDALAAGIVELIEDDERRRAMGAAAFDKAQRYTTRAMAQRWESLFLQLADQRGVRR